MNTMLGTLLSTIPQEAMKCVVIHDDETQFCDYYIRHMSEKYKEITIHDRISGPCDRFRYFVLRKDGTYREKRIKGPKAPRLEYY